MEFSGSDFIFKSQVRGSDSLWHFPLPSDSIFLAILFSSPAMRCAVFCFSYFHSSLNLEKRTKNDHLVLSTYSFALGQKSEIFFKEKGERRTLGETPVSDWLCIQVPMETGL